MRELKLFTDTVILTSDGPIYARDAKRFKVIDGFGEHHTIADVTPSGKAKAALLHFADHGDPFVLPSDAKVKPRTPVDGRYTPVEVSALSSQEHYFLMPNRKLRLRMADIQDAMPQLPTDLITATRANSADHLLWFLQALDHVEKGDPAHVKQGLVLKFDDIFAARLAGEMLGLYGIRVTRHPNRPWIYPDQRRPSCVFSKLVAGVLHGEAVVDVLFEFYGKGMLAAPSRIDDRLIMRCINSGVLQEGQPVENLVKLHQVRVSDRERETVTLYLHEHAHVETTWAQL